MQKKTIFFDLDDTLYDRWIPYAAAFGQFFSGQYAHLARAAFHAVLQRGYEVFVAAHTGQITMDAMHIYRHQTGLRDVGLAISADEALQMQALYAAEQRRIRPSAAMCDALTYARAHFAALGVITNGSSRTQRGKLQSLGMECWLDEALVFISDECGVMKPAPELFLRAQQAAGSGPCVFVGDSCSQDIAPAAACGWQTIWMNRTGQTPVGAQPDFIVHSDEELYACLQALSRETTPDP